MPSFDNQKIVLQNTEYLRGGGNISYFKNTFEYITIVFGCFMHSND